MGCIQFSGGNIGEHLAEKNIHKNLMEQKESETEGFYLQLLHSSLWWRWEEEEEERDERKERAKQLP